MEEKRQAPSSDPQDHSGRGRERRDSSEQPMHRGKDEMGTHGGSKQGREPEEPKGPSQAV
jgi:hypothetical protein